MEESEQIAVLGISTSERLWRLRAEQLKYFSPEMRERIPLTLGIFRGINSLIPVPQRRIPVSKPQTIIRSSMVSVQLTSSHHGPSTN